MAFGNAEGGAEGGITDLNQLKRILNSADEETEEREAENRMRFALGCPTSQLRLHLGALDAQG